MARYATLEIESENGPIPSGIGPFSFPVICEKRDPLPPGVTSNVNQRVNSPELCFYVGISVRTATLLDTRNPFTRGILAEK
jgi:hypothetical protein